MADTDKTLSLRIKAEAEGEQEIAALTQEIEDLKSEAAKPIPDPTETFKKGMRDSGLSAAALQKEIDVLFNKLAQFRKTVEEYPKSSLFDQLQKEADTVTQAFNRLGLSGESIESGINQAELAVIQSFKAIAGSALTTSQEIEAAFNKARTAISTTEGITEFKTVLQSISPVLSDLYNQFNKIGLQKNQFQAIQDEADQVSESFKKLGLSAESIETGINQSELEIIKSFKTIANSALVTSDEIRKAFISANSAIKTPQGLKEFRNALVETTGSANQFQAFFPDIDNQIKKTSVSTKEAADNTDLFGNAIKSLIALGAAKYFVDTADAMIKLKTGLNQVNQSTEQTQKDLAFLKGVSDKLGLSLDVVGQQYLALAAAAKGTNLEGNATKNIFESVTTAMAALGKSGPEVENALRAIQQIMSKGKLSAEELRGQLGEALPGAFQIAAKSIGVTTAELDKMLEQGLLFSEEFLPKFAKELNKTFGDTKPIETWQASFNRALNDVNATLIAFSETGVAKFGTSLIDAAGKVVISLKAIPIAVENVASGIGATAGAFATGGDALAAFADETRSMTSELEDLVFQVAGAKTQAEFLADTERKLAEESEKLITPLQRLQDAAKSENFEKLDQSIRTAIDGIKKTGDVAAGAQEALKKFVEAPAELAEPTKVLELANVIQLIGAQADNSANQLRQGLGKALEKLTSEQLLALQNQAQTALDSAAKGSENARLAFIGLGDIVENVAIASLNKLGIDGVEALKNVDAGFKDVIGALYNLSKNAVVSGEVLAQAFTKGISASTTVSEIDLVRNALLQAGKYGKLSAEQIAIAMTSVNEKTAELYAAVDPLTQALNRFGIDSTEAFTGLDAEMQASIQTLDILANSARVTGDVLYKAVTESIDAATTTSELEVLTVKIEEFGKAGKLSAQEVKLAIAELNVKLESTKEYVDPVSKAFETLGVTSARELKAIADQAVASFEIIKQSGASIGEVNAAFEAMAEKVAAAGEAAGPIGEAMALASLKAKAATEEQIEAVQKLEKALGNVQDASENTAQAQIDAINKTTEALNKQQQQLSDIEKSMVGIQVATIKIGNQMAVAFDTKGIQAFNYLAQQVNNWLEQAAIAIENLNSGDWRSVGNARSLLDAMADVSGYMEDTVKTVKDDLVKAIEDAKDRMRDFADTQKDALNSAREELENLKNANNDFAQEQLRHKRELADLEEALRQAQQQRNREAISAILEQIRIENERHKIILSNLNKERAEEEAAAKEKTKNAKELENSTKSTKRYVQETAEVVRTDLVDAISMAAKKMADFADDQKDSLQRAKEELEDLRVANDEFAQEQLRHKRELAELDEVLRQAQEQRNQEAINFVQEQINVENEKHKLLMDNIKKEKDEIIGGIKQIPITAGISQQAMRSLASQFSMKGLAPGTSLTPGVTPQSIRDLQARLSELDRLKS